VKAAAALDPRTAGHPRRGQDVAFLLACIDEPIAVADELSTVDLQLLRQLASGPLIEKSRAWLVLDEDDRRRGQAALDLMINT